MLVSSHLYYDNKPVAAAPTAATRGIVRRGRRYQLRVRLPAPLARQTGRRELRLALGTANLREALRRGLPLLTRLEQLFYDLGGGIVIEQTVHHIIRQFHHHLLHNLPGSEQLRLHSSLSIKEIEQAAADYRRLVGYDRAALKFGKFEHIAQTLDRFAEDHGISIDKTSDNYYLLLQQALLARIKAFETKEQQALGNHQSILDAAPAQQPTNSQTPQAPQQTLTILELCNHYIHEKNVIEGAWDEHGTLPEVKRALDTFRDLIGGDDVLVSSINRAMLNDYKTKLTLLPKRTLKRYQDKSPRELLAMEIPQADRISKSNINLHLKWVMALMDWAETNDHITKTPAKRLTIKRTSLEKNYRDIVLPYSDAEVRMIADRLTYAPNRPERFWVPLIAAYTGGRLDEICQLLTKDVCEVGGVLCFRITLADDLTDPTTKKKLKTQASKRNVPVHRDLLALGFADYWKQIKASKAIRLFPELPASKKGYGVELGKWYGREISDKLFATHKRVKVFNSYRHSVEDKFKNFSDMRDSMQSYLTGHATGSQDFDRYGSPPMAIELKRFVDRIDYGLDVADLKNKIANPVVAQRRRAPRKPVGTADTSRQ
ncbi:MAG: site-specific integrase [Trichlorobacter sp.]